MLHTIFCYCYVRHTARKSTNFILYLQIYGIKNVTIHNLLYYGGWGKRVDASDEKISCFLKFMPCMVACYK